jgi:hypothetical protein
MGEDLEGDGPFPIQVRVVGTAPIERVEFWDSGELAHSQAPESGRAADLEWSWSGPPADAHGWLAVRVVQEDGHKAWASPFFARWERAGPTRF